MQSNAAGPDLELARLIEEKLQQAGLVNGRQEVRISDG
jgi:hypothetical protein